MDRHPLRKVAGGRLGAVALALPAMIGTVLVLYATARGAWMGSDSVEYLVSARNLIAGKGMGMDMPSGDFAPLSHFPPAYPAAIAALSVATGDVAGAARGADAILIASVSLLLGLGSFVALGSLPVALLMAVIPITAGVLPILFSGAMSEPLFILFACIGCFCLAMWLTTPGPLWLVVAGLSLGLAALTRYAGVPLVGAGFLAVVIFARMGWKERLGSTGWYLLFSAGPIGAWISWLAMPQNGVEPRGVVLPDPSTLWETTQTIRGSLVDALWVSLPYAQWLPKLHYTERLALLSVGALLTFCVPLLWRRWRNGWTGGGGDLDASAWQMLAVGWMFLVCYVAGLAVAAVLVRPAPDVDARMMSPAALLMWWLYLSMVAILSRGGRRRRRLATLALVSSALYLATLVPGVAGRLTELHINGRGYTSVAWQASPTIPILRAMPAGEGIVTNDSAAVLYLAGRPAYDLPEIVRNEPVPVFRRFGEDDTIPAERLFREGKAVLVLFDSLYWQLKPLYGSGTDERIRAMTEGLVLERETMDAKIYRWKAP